MNSMRLCGLLGGLTLTLAAQADPLRPGSLPPPRLEAGRPLMAVLKARQSRRDIRPDRPLATQQVSDLLWAACGVNRPESGKRTAPTASNWQEIELYAASAEGLFHYDAKGHRLEQVLKEDLRPAAAKQKFAQAAPLILIYVADYARMRAASAPVKDFYAAVDTGFVSQNVYLWCASEGLATVVLGMVDKPALAAAMNLGPDQKVVLTQPVGYPAGD